MELGVIHPIETKHLIANAENYEKSSNFKEAIELYSEYIRHHKDSIYAYERRAFLLYKIGEFRKAILDYSTLIRMNNSNTKYYKNRASLYKKVGSYDKCKSDIERLISLYSISRNEEEIKNMKQNLVIINLLLNNLDEESQILTINDNPQFIQYITNPTEKVIIAALSLDGHCIQYINDPPESLQYVAIRTNYTAIKYINNPFEEIQYFAVSRCSSAIDYIENPTEKVINNPFVQKYLQKKKEENENRYNIPEFNEDDRVENWWN